MRAGPRPSAKHPARTLRAGAPNVRGSARGARPREGTLDRTTSTLRAMSSPSPSEEHPDPHQEHPFAAVAGRRSVDELFRNVQQALVAYTGQADLKANIVITTSSLVLTIVATRWSEASLRPGLSAVAIGALLALLTAITVVIPKFRLPRKG